MMTLFFQNIEENEFLSVQLLIDKLINYYSKEIEFCNEVVN